MIQEFQAGDRTARGYLAVPTDATGTGPAVLVLHAWWGLTDQFTEVCDRLAGAGFVAFAPDLFEGSIAATIAEAERLAQGSDETRIRAITSAATAFLGAHPSVRPGPIGVAGFSFGAAWALLLSTALPDDIGAVVLFYGTYTGLDFSAAHAAYLGHFAEQDDFEPLPTVREQEEQIRAAGREVSFHTYPGTHHWFFEANRPDAYDPGAAQLAWERTVAFLQHQLARP